MKNYSNKSKPHGVKIGDLFNMSWGYDQTNNNFFQVIRTSDSGVWVREVGASAVAGTGGFMCEDIKVTKDNFLTRSQWCGETNEPTFRRIQFSTWSNETKACFNFRGRYFAFPTTPDEKHYNSWYA